MANELIPKARTATWPDLFDRFLFDFPRWPGWRGFEEEVGSFRVEEKVEHDHLVVRAEIPGVDPEKDVDIHVRDHRLTIRAERKEETKTEDKGQTRSEFRYGSFARSVMLPPDADESDVTATYKDGILEVRMPLDRKRAEATKIEVTKL